MLALQSDFGDWMSPMLVKELRQGLRTKSFLTVFLLIQALMAFFFCYSAVDFSMNPKSFSTAGISGIFWTLLGVVLTLVMPLRALGAISQEAQGGTLELLFLTRLSTWRIVWGKWFSIMLQSMLFVVAVLPYLVVRYFFGRVDLVEDFKSLALTLLVSGCLTAVAVGLSALPRWLRGTVVAGPLLLGGSGLLSLLSMSGGSSGSPFASMEGSDYLVMTLICVGVGVYGLCFGASFIAPPSENHEGRLRGLCFAMMIAGGLASLLGEKEGFIILIFTVVLTGMTIVTGLCSSRPLFEVHLAGWNRAGWLGRIGSVFFLPGWQGAVLFSAAATTLLTLLLASTGLISHSAGRWMLASVGANILGALLTPCLLTLFIFRRFHTSIIVHAIIHAVLVFASTGILSLWNIKQGGAEMQVPFFLSFFPTAGFFGSFWVSTSTSQLRLLFTMGCLTSSVILVVLLAASRAYWSDVFRRFRGLQASGKA